MFSCSNQVTTYICICAANAEWSAKIRISKGDESKTMHSTAHLYDVTSIFFVNHSIHIHWRAIGCDECIMYHLSFILTVHTRHVLCSFHAIISFSLSLSSFLCTLSIESTFNVAGYSSQMSSHDCFEMGRQSYLNKDYYHTSLWMNEAMDRLNNNTNETTSIPKADILEYLAFSVFKQGKQNHPLEMVRSHQRWIENHLPKQKPSHSA